MLKTRIITALILGSLLVLTILFKPAWFLFLSFLFILVGIWEWFNLFSFDEIVDKTNEKIVYLTVFPIFFIVVIFMPISWTVSNLYPLSDYQIPILNHSFIADAADHSPDSFFGWLFRPSHYAAMYASLFFFWLVIPPLMIINYQKKLFHQTTTVIYSIDTNLKPKWLWRTLTIGPEATVQSFMLGNFLLWGLWVSLYILLSMSPYILLFFLLIVWSADTAAYFSGKKYGKHILADNVSPGKTWEGVIGGLITGILATFLALHFFREFLSVDLFQASPIKIILLSSVTVIYSIVGDLFISLIKRQTGKKDSGILFPGHGGVLDRIDSLMSGSVAFIFWGIFLDLFDFGLI